MVSMIRRIARAIQAAVPGLHAKGGMLAATPRGRILRGFFIDRTSVAERVCVYTFVQPLYVPAPCVVLSLGERIRGTSQLWGIDDIDALDAVVRAEVGFFADLHSPEALAEWELLQHGTDEYSRQALAYSLVLSNQEARALPLLRELATCDGTAWRVAIGACCAELAALVETNPKDAVDLIDHWEAETVAAMRVDDVP
jgi:hypothetical protein